MVFVTVCEMLDHLPYSERGVNEEIKATVQVLDEDVCLSESSYCLNSMVKCCFLVCFLVCACLPLFLLVLIY